MIYAVATIIIIALTWLLISVTGVDLSSFSGAELFLFGIIGLVTLVYVVSLMSDYRGRAAAALRHSAIWIGLFLVLMLGYTFRNDVSHVARRFAVETMPPGTGVSFPDVEPGRHAVRIRRSGDGHFSARGRVNNASIDLLVDTGASTVVLSPRDAQNAGININALNYSVPVNTANGTAFAAAVKLKSVSIGSIEVNDIEALVAKPGALSKSLLGMSFLRRLQSYEFSGDFLTLKG